VAEHARTHLLNIVRKYLRKNQPLRPSQSLATGVLPKGWNVSRSNQEMWRESRDVKGCEGMWRDVKGCKPWLLQYFAIFCDFVTTTTTSSRICSIFTMKSVTVSLHIHAWHPIARKFRWGKFQSQTKRQSLFGDLLINYFLIFLIVLYICHLSSYHIIIFGEVHVRSVQLLLKWQLTGCQCQRCACWLGRTLWGSEDAQEDLLS
jgi:hypothetical protein